ncbi:hypothetical protein GCM10025864_44550 [Luteimicrobium album]|uniref:Uncharacterized protein n=1 Tax=Luteimicrobium album TaxID=1054550 RepID=A0ABQ6HXJ1_9MICO|nr:hypothetical protein [Luteimicrobium album]GMA22290.1 hypothetical protein GCM10025864_00490 [Luteimicrobium album]GMA26696.1 hypothetical protein GCM10025864_44550 [Luteimicrobium album]
MKKYGSLAAAIKQRDKDKAAAKAASDKQKADTAAAKQAAADFKSLGSDLKTDIRRGDVADAITGGLDSALGVTDQARQEATSSTLSKKQKTALTTAANTAEKSLTSLYAAADKYQAALDKANNHLADMKSLADSAASAVKGTFDLSAAYVAPTDATSNQIQHSDKYGNVWYTTDTTAATKGGYTGAGITSAADKQAKDATTFTNALQALQKKLGTSPASEAIVNQALSIFASSPEQGIQFVQALNTMSVKDLGAVKSDYNTVAKAGTSAGQSLTSANTIGGLTAATTAVNSLTKSLTDTNNAIAKVGNTLTNAMLKPFGLKLDAKGNVVKKAGGGLVVGGQAGADSVHALLMPDEFVSTTASTARNQSALAAGNAGAVLTVQRPSSTPVPAAAAGQRVEVTMPRELVVVDTDGALVGRMKVEASRVVVAHTARQDAQAAYSTGSL